MRKDKKVILNLILIILTVAIPLLSATPAKAVGATISKIDIYTTYHGANVTTTIWQGGWVNRTVYFDVGHAPKITIYTTGGTGTITYQLLNDEGYNGTWDGTDTSRHFYPYPVEADYRAQVDGNWLGGSFNNEFYVRTVYPDLIASKPTPNSSADFCVGETVDWDTRVTNISLTETDNYSYVGYYLGTSSGDFSYRWESDSVGDLGGEEWSDEHEEYTFQASDVGTRYINVKADYEETEVEESEGNNTNSSDSFVVNPIPSPDFSASQTSGSPGVTIDFTNLTSGGATSYLWLFGDGGTSTQTDPSHTYNSAGTYTVTLTSTNDCGSPQEQKSNYITIAYLAVVADFSANVTTGDPPLDVSFTDQSTGDPTSWAWNFGDSGTSSSSNPSHLYSSPGAYTVSLTAANPGDSDNETKTDYINIPPQPDFTANVTSGDKPLTVTFTDQTFGSVDIYAWDFGDGVGTSALSDPEYVYNDAGFYTVELTVTGPGGSKAETKTDYIEVTVASPVADFTADPVAGVKPLLVTFTDSSTGEIDTWSWDFGDGGTSTSPGPVDHTYNIGGIYDVSLTVSGPGGSDIKTVIDMISVSSNDPVISDVKITNVRDTSFVVSWFTDIISSGQINYGTTGGLGTIEDDDRGASHSGESHYVIIDGLDPGITYYLDVVSGGTTDDNGGVHYQVITGPTLGIPAADTAYGKVYESDGATPAEGAIVYFKLSDNNSSGSSGESAEMSALVDGSGTWGASLGVARVPDLTSYFSYSSSGDTLILHAVGGSKGEDNLNVDTGSDFPAPDLVLMDGGPDNVGFYVPDQLKWYLKNNQTTGWTEFVAFKFGGPSGSLAVSGDWDNDGIDTVGFYVPSQGKWYLKNNQITGWNDFVAFNFTGPSGSIPVAGDWDNDGVDTVGFYVPSQGKWYLKNNQITGWNDYLAFNFTGPTGSQPVAGDWDNDGVDTIGFYVPSQGKWYLKNNQITGWNDFVAFNFTGASGSLAVAGDWDGDGVGTVGFYVPSQMKWYLKNNQITGWNDYLAFKFGGPTGSQPVAGDWD